MIDVALNPIEERLLIESHDDYVGLWAFVWAARREAGAGTPAERREAAMKMVSRMLEAGLIEAGTPTRDLLEINRWDGSADEVIERINEEWNRMGHEPGLDDGVYFVISDRGERYLEERDLL